MTSRSSPAGAPSRVEDSGGLLREKGAHFFDLSCWLLGERPREIYVAADCLVDAAFGAGGDLDTAAIVLRFGSGALCLMDFSRRSAYGYDERVEVFGAGGVLRSRGVLCLWRRGGVWVVRLRSGGFMVIGWIVCGRVMGRNWVVFWVLWMATAPASLRRFGMVWWRS